MKKHNILSLFVLAGSLLLAACGKPNTPSTPVSSEEVVTSEAHEHSLKTDAPYCEGCGQYVIEGETYSLTRGKNSTDSIESFSFYTTQFAEFKTGKNLLKFVPGENEMHFEADCGFFFAFYQTAEALEAGDWNKDVKVASCNIYGKDGNKLAEPENNTKNSGQYNFWGTEETYVYADDLYVLVEVTADVTAYIYAGDC